MDKHLVTGLASNQPSWVETSLSFPFIKICIYPSQYISPVYYPSLTICLSSLHLSVIPVYCDSKMNRKFKFQSHMAFLSWNWKYRLIIEEVIRLSTLLLMKFKKWRSCTKCIYLNVNSKTKWKNCYNGRELVNF